MDTEEQIAAYNIVVATILEEKFKESGITYPALEGLTGLSKSTLIRTIANKKNVKTGYIITIARALNLPLGSLFTAADKRFYQIGQG